MQNQTSGYESVTTSGECSWEAVGDLPGRRLPPVPSGPGTLPAVGTRQALARFHISRTFHDSLHVVLPKFLPNVFLSKT